MIKISDVPLACNTCLEIKLGSSSVLERCLHLKVFIGVIFMKLLHTTHAANALRFVWSCWKKLPLKRRQIADLFLRVSYASLLPLKKFSPSSKDYLVSS